MNDKMYFLSAANKKWRESHKSQVPEAIKNQGSKINNGRRFYSVDEPIGGDMITAGKQPEMKRVVKKQRKLILELTRTTPKHSNSMMQKLPPFNEANTFKFK